MLGINSLIKSQFVTKSTKYLSKSVGREKMARLGQYTSQFIFLYTGSLLASQLQQHFKFLFKCLGLFKPLGSIQQVVLIEESWQFGSLMSWFNLFRVYSLFLWQVFDQYNILSLLSIVNSKSFHLSPIIPRLANYFWLSTLFWTVMVEYVRISYNNVVLSYLTICWENDPQEQAPTLSFFWWTMGFETTTINSLGRIGKLALRIALARKNSDVIAINDPFISADYAAYMFKYDSTHGKYAVDISSEGEYLTVDSHKIIVYQERNPVSLPWKCSNIDIAIDATGIFKELHYAQKYLDAGAKKVVITSPSAAAPMFVKDVNEKDYNGELIVSNAKLINDSFGFEEGLMTTVHSMTATQFTDHGGRSASHNIIPSSTGSKAVGKVLPEYQGKLTEMSFRVSTVDGSNVDLTVKLKNPTTYDEIKKVVKAAFENEVKGVVIGYTVDVVVSH
ncbi:glyceraldehyde 3-phosphate dehydrogenase [Monosporozyma unispora]|nr:glyceraldehyde 3-phosphate dehydrogenase [Kazachstania unispora]